MNQKLQVKRTSLDGVMLITPPTIFEDFRGSYVETYNEKFYSEAGVSIKFVQDDISTSYRNVLRGIHGDSATWKLISCLYGEFYLVVLNYDSDSLQFGQWEGFTLSDCNRLQVLVPPKFGNGHAVVSESAIFHYKKSTYYSRKTQFTVLWNDQRFNIEWPFNEPLLSKRDQGLGPA